MPDKPPKVPAHLLERFAEPDMLTTMIGKLVEKHPEIADGVAELEQDLRAEFGGQNIMIRKRNYTALYAAIRADYNGRNINEVMARYGVSRATVHRITTRKVTPQT